MSETSLEQVLVVPTAVFHSLGYFQGFNADVDKYFKHLLDPAHTSYRPRAEMEQDPGFKQLIPYCVFQHTDAAGGRHLFAYTRGKGQGEGRLHSKRSIGVGGHISTEDAQAAAHGAYQEGMRRELEEEIHLESAYRQSCVGLINDDQSEVGRVHLGVVHLFELEQPLVRPRETELVECGFHPVAELLADLSRFETWSQICLEALFAAAPGGVSHASLIAS